VASWALVVGIDRYWSDAASLKGAVRDALSAREWLLDPAGGNVPPDNLFLVLAPAKESPDPGDEVEWEQGTKANITLAVNNLVQLSGGKGERLFFYYAGHGLTTRVSNRDESALLATDFTEVLTDNSIALRSLWEYFETLQFDDQFFFVDACRNEPPWGDAAFELGRWTLPRSRDPGLPPVQQFILYATSPKLKTVEDRETPGEEHGVFTAALLDGLRGKGAAKAWSWDRRCYEVRWERLVDFVKSTMEAAGPRGDEFQIPQDAGSRGVAGRDRDPVVVAFPAGAFGPEKLIVSLEPDGVYKTAQVSVLTGVGEPVESKPELTGTTFTFELPPKTYALRAEAPNYSVGYTQAPVELYDSDRPPETIALRPKNGGDEPEEKFGTVPPPAAGEKPSPGEVKVHVPDPLAIVEVRDNTGAVAATATGSLDVELPPGFYRIRMLGPESAGEERTIALASGERERKELKPPKLDSAVERLVKAAGGRIEDGTVHVDGLEPIAAPERSTIVALAGVASLHREPLGADLGLALADALPAKEESGVVVLLDSGGGRARHRTHFRLWPSGDALPADDEAMAPHALGHGIGALVAGAARGPHWLSIEAAGAPPVVLALTLLPGRVTMVVAQLAGDALRLWQYLPSRDGAPSESPQKLRRVEHLQRLLLAGRLDTAEPLARELAAAASEDPLAGCLGAYTLLRLGHAQDVGEVADGIVAAAPTIADAYVLRAESAAATGNASLAKQAFVQAVATGIPLFGEGLTRLVEGLRATGFVHPRAAIVRYVFQHHRRGTMWSAFLPQSFRPGRLLITGADTGSEA
jgi:hypothetical protein